MSRKCDLCGHSIRSHNELSNCMVESPTYGQCICDGTKVVERVRVRDFTAHTKKAMS